MIDTGRDHDHLTGEGPDQDPGIEGAGIDLDQEIEDVEIETVALGQGTGVQGQGTEDHVQESDVGPLNAGEDLCQKEDENFDPKLYKDVLKTI